MLHERQLTDEEKAAQENEKELLGIIQLAEKDPARLAAMQIQASFRLSDAMEVIAEAVEAIAENAAALAESLENAKSR